MLTRHPTLLLLWFALFGTGCANVYTGSARTMQRDRLTEEPGWLAVQRVPMIRQRSELDCGITALEMVARHHGGQLPADVRARQQGRWSARELRDLALAQGFRAFVIEGTVEDLVNELRAGRPVIVGVAKPVAGGKHVSHYEVVVGLHGESQRVATLDPALGPRQNTYQGFLSEWVATGSVLLVVIPE